MKLLSHYFFSLAELLSRLSNTLYRLGFSFLRKKAHPSAVFGYEYGSYCELLFTEKTQYQEIQKINFDTRVCISRDKLVWGFGVPYSKWNPLVIECQLPGFLDIFFQEFCPDNLFQAWYPKERPAEKKFSKFYGLVPDVQINLLPWLFGNDFGPTNDIAKSSWGHGSQFKGPLSDFNLEKEKYRIASLRHQIINEGYQPDKYGDIVGIFILYENDWRFLVLGGTHRAAVLSSLNVENIPVKLLDVNGAYVEQGIFNAEQLDGMDLSFSVGALFSKDGLEMREKLIEKCFTKYMKNM